MEKTKMLILMYSVIAVFILNLTYIARVNPELPCSMLKQGVQIRPFRKNTTVFSPLAR
jgi:hypothetical protein